MYDYGVLLCYKVIFLLHQKGSFYVGYVFVSFLPFVFFFPRITGFAGMSGGGEKWLCSWSFDTVCFGRGQLTLIQLTPCGFCTYSSVQYLYSRQTGNFYSFWNMYSKFLVSGFFLFIYLFIYLLPSISVSSARGDTPVRGMRRVVGASVFPFFSLFGLIRFSTVHWFITPYFMFFFIFLFPQVSFTLKFEEGTKREKKEKGRCLGDWESLRNGVWNFLLYISLFPLFSTFSSLIIDNSYFEMFWIKFVIHHSELNTYRYHIASAAGSNNPLFISTPFQTSLHIPPHPPHHSPLLPTLQADKQWQPPPIS